MIVTPYYNCRNCRKTYPGNTQEISSAQMENLIRAAGFTLGSSDHIWGNTSVAVMKRKIGQCYLKIIYGKRRIQTGIFKKFLFFAVENNGY